MPQLRYKDGVYWLRAAYEERHQATGAGFKWNRALKLFYTSDPFIANSFIDHCHDTLTHAQLTREIARINEKIQESCADDVDFYPPVPIGLKYLAFQRAGIKFAVDRKDALIADEMGLGKTVQAAGALNTVGFHCALVVCPASVKINWQRELEKWLIDWTAVGVVYGNKPWPGTPVVVINYDILSRFRAEIRSKVWDYLIVDECHYLKNPETVRTRQVLGKGKKDKGIEAHRSIFLTGTPIVNRPVDLYPVLGRIASDEFPSFWKYAMRYCNAVNGPWGWDFNGASNLHELQVKLRSTVMVRRLKKDVLKDLPGKVRQIIELPITGNTKALRAEKKRIKEYRHQVQELGLDTFAAFTEMAQIRHETALAKAPMVADHLREIIESGEKVVCFAWHRDVIEEIDRRVGCASVIITGSTKAEHRQELVDLFQEDPAFKLFIGNIQAAGTGITLTEASRVVFAELDWVPGNMTQAEDRCHRIGQVDSVHVQHLVLEGSLDAYIAKTLVRKQDNIDKALDGKEVEEALIDEVLEELFNTN